MITILVYFDFSTEFEAFGRVYHALLICKCMNLNFSKSVLTSIWPCLYGQRQTIRSEGDVSEWIDFLEGSTRFYSWSIIFFFLFSGYQLYNYNCKIIKYADDLQIYIDTPAWNINPAIALINEDVERIIL